MIRPLIVFWFLLPVAAAADCDSKIREEDTIGSVEAKLICFKNENAELEKALQLEKSKPRPIWMSLAKSPFTISAGTACVEKASKILQQGGWTITDQSGSHLGAMKGNDSVVADCNDPEVAAAGGDANAVDDIAASLFRKIFHDN